MQLNRDGTPLHLTYCLNIHPGETWAAQRAAITGPATAVRERLGWAGPFGLGLRLGARAVADLQAPEARDDLAETLAAGGFYAFTINGFPYGTFHGTRVKEAVYAPDWSTPERLTYTLRLAAILAELLPAGVTGSISTVPGTYRAWATPDRLEALAANLAAAALDLADLEERRGRRVVLALEPEPDCLWDETALTIGGFEEVILRRGAAWLQRRRGGSREAAEAILRRHLGVCLDTCHQAVLGEDPSAALQALQSRGIAVGKIQISAAPCFQTSPEGLAQASRFQDGCYLHQSTLITASARRRYADLPEALAAARALDEPGELRTHMHIPLVLAGGPGYISSRQGLGQAFWKIVAGGVAPHVEVETYTFDVLPPELRGQTAVESIAGELSWVRCQLAATGGIPAPSASSGAGDRAPA